MHFPNLSQLHCILFTRKLTPLDHWALSFPVWIIGVFIGHLACNLAGPWPPLVVCGPQATHTPRCEIHPRPRAGLLAALLTVPGRADWASHGAGMDCHDVALTFPAAPQALCPARDLSWYQLHVVLHTSRLPLSVGSSSGAFCGDFCWSFRMQLTRLPNSSPFSSFLRPPWCPGHTACCVRVIVTSAHTGPEHRGPAPHCPILGHCYSRKVNFFFFFFDLVATYLQ